MEDIKPEQFLMLTFSRTAANEFRSRLNQLVGELSRDIEIHTFHAYALKLIGRMVKEGDETLNRSIAEAVEQIRNNDIALPLKSVLVLDEYQDINQDSFELVDTIYRSNQEMRIIAVGDDDQCIMGHIGADPHFFDRFQEQFGTDEEGNENYQQYELSINFRSAPQIVSYSNHFIKRVKKRHKLHPLSAHKDEKGQVTVRICLGENLIAPAVEQVAQQTSHQSTAVLAYTNEEVMQIYAALHAKGIGAKYILDRDGFSLKNVVEIVYFDQILTTLLKGKNSYDEADFFEAYKLTEVKFKGSKNLPLLEKVIDKFLTESLSYHASQWLSYLDEIRLEDFESYAKAVTVSTIHKSKGMEFENVIMVVKQIPKQDQDLRLYYVGMTRAKKNLTIVHHGQDVFRKSEDAVYTFDETPYDEELGNAVFVMGLRDIYLDYKDSNNDADTEPLAGEFLTLQMRDKRKAFSLVYKNREIGLLSKNFHHQISSYLERGYRIQQVEIEYVLVWYSMKHKEYLKHPLCRISLRKE
jgi:ATP-dependent DNA helicase RecQ